MSTDQQNDSFLLMPVAADTDPYPAPPTDDVEALFSTLSLVFTFLMLVMCLAGAVMNTLSLVIFTSSGFRRRSINVLLSGLSASDLCLCLLAIPVFSLNQLQNFIPGLWFSVTSHILVYAYPVTLMAQTMSVWMLVSITVDRYLAVCHPFSVRIYCTVRRALLTIAVIVLFSVGYNFIRFWEYTINDAEGVRDEERIVGLLRENPLYMVLYQNIAMLLTQFVLPLAVLCLLNLQVARAILLASETRRELVASEKREYNTAKMMLFVVIVFIFCYMLSFCLNLLEIFHPDLFKQQIGFLLNDVNNVLVVINSSSSFVFYIKYSSRYRSQLRKMRIGLHRLSCWWTRLCFCLCAGEYDDAIIHEHTRHHLADRAQRMGGSGAYRPRGPREKRAATIHGTGLNGTELQPQMNGNNNCELPTCTATATHSGMATEETVTYTNTFNMSVSNHAPTVSTYSATQCSNAPPTNRRPSATGLMGKLRAIFGAGATQSTPAMSDGVAKRGEPLGGNGGNFLTVEAPKQSRSRSLSSTVFRRMSSAPLMEMHRAPRR